GPSLPITFSSSLSFVFSLRRSRFRLQCTVFAQLTRRIRAARTRNSVELVSQVFGRSEERVTRNETDRHSRFANINTRILTLSVCVCPFVTQMKNVSL